MYFKSSGGEMENPKTLQMFQRKLPHQSTRQVSAKIRKCLDLRIIRSGWLIEERKHYSPKRSSLTI